MRRRYPNTEYAKKADARMTALKTSVEEEQRNVKIEPNPPNLFLGVEIPHLWPTGLGRGDGGQRPAHLAAPHSAELGDGDRQLADSIRRFGNPERRAQNSEPPR